MSTCVAPGCSQKQRMGDLCKNHHEVERGAVAQAEFAYQVERADYLEIPLQWAAAPVVNTPSQVYTGDQEGTRYGLAGLRNIVSRLTESGGGRNNAIFAAGAQVGELVAGGQLESSYATDTMREAALNLCPDEKQKALLTLARGLRQGMKNPRMPAN